VLGLVYSADEEAPSRDFVEQNCGAVSKLAYMIVNDLKEFGFLSLDDHDRLLITPRGEKALQGVAKKIYGKKFKPDMLKVNQGEIANPKMKQAPKEDSEQANLF
jgi:ribosomal protein S19E (S16A)